MPSDLKGPAHGLPQEVEAIRAEIKKFYRSTDVSGKPISGASMMITALGSTAKNLFGRDRGREEESK